MQAHQLKITDNANLKDIKFDFEPDIILLFVSPNYHDTTSLLKHVSEQYPNATITGCSTSGEICDTNVVDNSVVLNALKFDKATHKLVSVDVEGFQKGFAAGQGISQLLSKEDLKHIIVFSDGLQVDGSELVKGLTENLDCKVSITGGLAGDGVDFKNTFTISEGKIQEGKIVGLGLYGPSLKVGYSSQGGWESFGIDREITKSRGPVLYELDGIPALDLYKKYLGDKAKDLPSSGLMFPLCLKVDDQKTVVRTLLDINEEDKSLTFAGNIPKGASVRLMKANVDKLIMGAEDSALLSQEIMEREAEFALLISCVGRRLVLKQIVEEELEAVRDVLGKKPVISGFYSYGEIAPNGIHQPCQLHNQTMTITTFSE